jgi:hypothetical protein
MHRSIHQLIASETSRDIRHIARHLESRSETLAAVALGISITISPWVGLKVTRRWHGASLGRMRWSGLVGLEASPYSVTNPISACERRTSRRRPPPPRDDAGDVSADLRFEGIAPRDQTETKTVLDHWVCRSRRAVRRRSFSGNVLDLRGRGNCEGERFHVEKFSDDVDNLPIKKIREPSLPLLLLGHYAGSVISSLYALDRQSDIAGVISECFAF